MSGLPNLILMVDPDPAFLGPIRHGLRAANEGKIGAVSRHPVAARLEAASGCVGGAYGWLHFGWLHIDWLWVGEAHRGSGLGRKLIERLESFALARGIGRARLNTGSFQAPEFYQKLGYQIFAQLPITADDGRAYVDYLLKKDLVDPSRPSLEFEPRQTSL